MRKLKVGDVLTKSRIPIVIDDETEYRQVTVRLKHQGVKPRGSKLGKDIGTKKQSVVRSGQFILSKIDARNGAFGIIPDELDGAIVTNDFLTYDVNEKELNIELFQLLTSQTFFDELCKKASTGTTNRKRLNEKMFLDQELILPPIEEQDKFIAHFKQLQSAQQQTVAELQTQTDLIAKLRSSILSDAVSGRLVPQNPADEPASVLLERIKAEKEKLIKEGKIKKQKPLPPISEDKIPYELPDGWVWCRLNDIFKFIDYRGKTPKKTDSGVKLITAKNIKKGFISDQPQEYIAEADYENWMTRGFPRDGDILFTTEAPLGNAAILYINKNKRIALAQRTINLQKIREELDSNYLLYCIISPYFQNELIKNQSGMTAKGIKSTVLKTLMIPLPPLSEQSHIASRVEKLMATCDALEAEVKKSRIETERLMQSVLKEAFGL